MSKAEIRIAQGSQSNRNTPTQSRLLSAFKEVE
jgi:hypothetical protein